jgi:hypothetical protein
MLAIALCLMLAGCRVTLWSYEWSATSSAYDPADVRDANGHLPGDDPAECQHGGHNAAGGYIEACGELPGMLGDDC